MYRSAAKDVARMGEVAPETMHAAYEYSNKFKKENPATSEDIETALVTRKGTPEDILEKIAEHGEGVNRIYAARNLPPDKLNSMVKEYRIGKKAALSTSSLSPENVERIYREAAENQNPFDREIAMRASSQRLRIPLGLQSSEL